MKKFLKPGRVVIMLTGRFAGKRAVILKVYYEGSKSRKFGHCLVAGIERYPRKVNKNMTEKRIQRRIAIKPFLKYVNFNHFMPTRYVISSQLNVKDVISNFDKRATSGKSGEVDKNRDPLRNVDYKSELRKKVRNLFQSSYKKVDLNDDSSESNIVKFMFQPLRF